MRLEPSVSVEKAEEFANDRRLRGLIREVIRMTVEGTAGAMAGERKWRAPLGT